MATGRRGDRPSRSPLEEELLGALQSPYDGGGEAGAVGTVGDAVVERERERQRSEEHTSELQSLAYLVCRLLLEKKKTTSTSVAEAAQGAYSDGSLVPRLVRIRPVPRR